MSITVTVVADVPADITSFAVPAFVPHTNSSFAPPAPGALADAVIFDNPIAPVVSVRLDAPVKILAPDTAPDTTRLVPVAAPIAGVVMEHETVMQTVPVPDSSDSTLANSDDVVAAKTLNLFAVYVAVPPAPKATELASAPVSVKVLFAVNVFPAAIVSVPVPDVHVLPLKVVASRTLKISAPNAIIGTSRMPMNIFFIFLIMDF